MDEVVTVPEDVAGISHTYVSIQAAKFLFMDACGQVPPISQMMQEQKLLMLSWRSFSGLSR